MQCTRYYVHICIVWNVSLMRYVKLACDACYTICKCSVCEVCIFSGFVFLRLLCPAILNPKQFNLITGIYNIISLCLCHFQLHIIVLVLNVIFEFLSMVPTEMVQVTPLRRNVASSP